MFLERWELLAAKRFTSQERTYIVVTPCQFIFLKRVGETLFAKLREMARLPSACGIRHASGCVRELTGTSAIF